MGAAMAAAEELEKKVKSVLTEEEDDVTHTTFGQRAEAYYQKRPQLLSLLNTLYTSYLTLSGHRHHHRRLSSSDFEAGSSSCVTAAESDADSCAVSSSCSTLENPKMEMVVEKMVVEVVMGSVNMNLAVMMMEEEGEGIRRRELRRKVELQRSLVEVLESERLILLKENARLRYDNTALAWEAAELGRCLMRLRKEDHRRSSLLASKIADLQAQIHALDRRNQDYSEQLIRRQGEEGGGVRATVARWWDQIRRLEFLVCGAGQGQGQGRDGPARSQRE